MRKRGIISYIAKGKFSQHEDFNRGLFSFLFFLILETVLHIMPTGMQLEKLYQLLHAVLKRDLQVVVVEVDIHIRVLGALSTITHFNISPLRSLCFTSELISNQNDSSNTHST